MQKFISFSIFPMSLFSYSVIFGLWYSSFTISATMASESTVDCPIYCFKLSHDAFRASTFKFGLRSDKSSFCSRPFSDSTNLSRADCMLALNKLSRSASNLSVFAPAAAFLAALSSFSSLITWALSASHYALYALFSASSYFDSKAWSCVSVYSVAEFDSLSIIAIALICSY